MKPDSNALCDLYVARIPDAAPTGELWPPERACEVAQTKNERAKKEKYYVWRLLEHALAHSLGLCAQNLAFFKDENGKWGANGVFFSLSHTAGAVAVAVSRTAVGVDIEQYRTPRTDRLAARVLTARELADFEKTPERDAFLLQTWVGKEAIFKKGDEKKFSPANIETTDANVVTGTFDKDGVNCAFAVATDTPEVVRIFKDVDLSAH